MFKKRPFNSEVQQVSPSSAASDVSPAKILQYLSKRIEERLLRHVQDTKHPDPVLEEPVPTTSMNHVDAALPPPLPEKTYRDIKPSQPAYVGKEEEEEYENFKKIPRAAGNEAQKSLSLNTNSEGYIRSPALVNTVSTVSTPTPITPPPSPPTPITPPPSPPTPITPPPSPSIFSMDSGLDESFNQGSDNRVLRIIHEQKEEKLADGSRDRGNVTVSGWWKNLVEDVYKEVKPHSLKQKHSISYIQTEARLSYARKIFCDTKQKHPLDKTLCEFLGEERGKGIRAFIQEPNQSTFEFEVRKYAKALQAEHTKKPLRFAKEEAICKPKSSTVRLDKQSTSYIVAPANLHVHRKQQALAIQ